ncbi:hypothetical protein AYI68_g4757 [Smittium mucronatum]|uniref:BRCT domain-containing protein n=1 Tax=Smittium mucronatum TaxID=133383 RepID=A0A1R0GW79_9FUNG|nr:hypothetical protein AYI68_g4757 [Smittium mucronatum]
MDSVCNGPIISSHLLVPCRVEDSLAHDRLLDYSEYEVRGCEKHQYRFGPQKSRSLKLTELLNQSQNFSLSKEKKPNIHGINKLFSQMRFYLGNADEWMSPSYSQICDLIAIGGGTIINQKEYSIVSSTDCENKLSFLFSNRTVALSPLRIDSKYVKKSGFKEPKYLANTGVRNDGSLMYTQDENFNNYPNFRSRNGADNNGSNTSIYQAGGRPKPIIKVSFVWLFDCIDKFEIISDLSLYYIF